MAKTERAIGRPLNRVDGRLKVTGGARYAAEAEVANVAHGVLVVSSIAKGRIKSINASAAEKVPGVLAVISHRNAPKVALPATAKGLVDPEAGEPLQPFQDNVVRYHGQPIALVVAERLEQAVHAATLVRATYDEDKAILSFSDAAAKAVPPTPPKSERGKTKAGEYQRGNPENAWDKSEVRIDQTYTIPDEYHNPMEMHATIALWEERRLTVYDKTQFVDNVQKQLAAAFGIPREDVRVLSPFVGGAFGAALRTWVHTFIAAIAAQHVRRPVKLVLSRAQMYVVPGYRPHTTQRIRLGAGKDGTLTAIRHDAIAKTSTYEEYTESTVSSTRYLYACPNVSTVYRLAPVNHNTPASMRGPGEATGAFALESALDELAYALRMDPVELRRRNHADSDPESGLPWSSKSLNQCYTRAAERFGWARRKPEPRSMTEGRLLVGWGTATATWPTHRLPATVLVRLNPDGTATVRTGASDIGPGTYTVMTQVAADTLGLPVARVHFDLGDSRMPPAPVEGGSMTMASVGSAVHEAAMTVKTRLFELARDDKASPLHRATLEQVDFEEGRIFRRDDPKRGESYVDLLRRHRRDGIEVRQQSAPGGEAKKFSMHAFGAHFVEVRVDPDLATVRIARVVSAFAAGRIINPKTAHSQAIGGIVGGLGMALLEDCIRDHRNGRVINANFVDYLVPVHADIPNLDAFYIEETDTHVNPIGVKGLAELSLVGVAPAVANAVYHATGKRVRELPIRIEQLL